MASTIGRFASTSRFLWGIRCLTWVVIAILGLSPVVVNAAVTGSWVVIGPYTATAQGVTVISES